ncbi:MAG TPA: FoF1 ATP synthase subunit gamma, partial [Gemmataceae bacterium]
VEVLADRYVKMYTDREIDRLDVAYMKFLSAGRQAAVAETMLPLSAVGSEGPAPAGPGVDYEFVPAAGEILEELVPMAFKIRLFKCFLDAAVSEQIARRVAMKAATENAGELINRISRTYNRERQAQITKEISEVIGGAEALK